MSHTIDASLEHALQEGEGGFSEGQADLSDPVGVPQQDGPSTSQLSEALILQCVHECCKKAVGICSILTS